MNESNELFGEEMLESGDDKASECEELFHVTQKRHLYQVGVLTVRKQRMRDEVAVRRSTFRLCADRLLPLLSSRSAAQLLHHRIIVPDDADLAMLF